nr:PREDICTED: peptidyl-prolyl cis-trans isomerase FKBP8-like [Lepisosteus oculatus]
MERPELGTETVETCPYVEAWNGLEEGDPLHEPPQAHKSREEEQVNSGGSAFGSLCVPGTESAEAAGEGGPDGKRKLEKTPSFGKTVRFQLPPNREVDMTSVPTEESFFPRYELHEWTAAGFEELFLDEEWLDITEEGFLRKRVLQPGQEQAASPSWGQEVTVKLQGVLEDGTVVEKDPRLTFVIGEGDVNQALELCAPSMQLDEIALLITDSQYAYGQRGREPDIPPGAALLYQLHLLHIRDKPDPRTLPASDCIRVGNQKRELGNFYFQREEYSKAARSYRMALEALREPAPALEPEETEEVRECWVKCLNNMAATQLKLEQCEDALGTSEEVLLLDPNNVKALFRKGKLLSDKGEYQEAMEVLKKALKLEPSTKAIHVELSKLVKRQAGGSEVLNWKAKPAQMLGENITPFLKAAEGKPSGIPWKWLLGALVVAIGCLLTAMFLPGRN